MVILAGCQTKTVPPLLDVSYAGKLSDEPVMVQSFSIPGESTATIRSAVITAARHRGWDVTEQEDGRIRAYLKHRTSESTLFFDVAGTTVDIYSVSYEIDKKTQARKGREEPEGWIRNLHKDLLVRFGLLTDS